MFSAEEGTKQRPGLKGIGSNLECLHGFRVGNAQSYAGAEEDMPDSFRGGGADGKRLSRTKAHPQWRFSQSQSQEAQSMCSMLGKSGPTGQKGRNTLELGFHQLLDGSSGVLWTEISGCPKIYPIETSR